MLNIREKPAAEAGMEEGSTHTKDQESDRELTLREPSREAFQASLLWSTPWLQLCQLEIKTQGGDIDPNNISLPFIPQE